MNQTVVKKITPYPIQSILIKSSDPTPRNVAIVKLVEHGFLIQADIHYLFQVGDLYEVKFEIPVIHIKVQNSCKVIKTYDAIESVVKGQKNKLHTAELHFINLPSDLKIRINEFLSKIGQKG